eukprot:symbB.v1.2.034404.t1/scaffold4434.1/size39729/2
MSLIHELSQTTAQAQLETERLVDSLVAKEKDLLFGNQRINQALQVRFTQQCRMAAQNERNSCSMEVRLSDEIKNRDGAKDVTEQKLWTMLAEVGLHDGTVVEQPDPFSIDMYDFLVRATWPVADAASPKEASPERARGTSITCPICHEQRPAVVLMPCGHVVCRNCRRCRKFRQCPMCRGPENLQLCNLEGGESPALQPRRRKTSSFAMHKVVPRVWRRPQNPHSIKAMSLIHELSQTTAQARRHAAERKRLYDLETERLVVQLVATEKERFPEACRKAARNQKNNCYIGVKLSDEVKNRTGARVLTEQKLRAMLVELGFHNGSVERPGPHYFLVGATWPVADAADQASTKRRRRTSPERAGGTFITCPICHEHRPAVVLMPCGHVVCQDCQRGQQFRQCPMCRRSVFSASDGLFMD